MRRPCSSLDLRDFSLAELAYSPENAYRGFAPSTWHFFPSQTHRSILYFASSQIALLLRIVASAGCVSLSLSSIFLNHCFEKYLNDEHHKPCECESCERWKFRLFECRRWSLRSFESRRPSNVSPGANLCGSVPCHDKGEG